MYETPSIVDSAVWVCPDPMVALSDACQGATGRPRGGTPMRAITVGHNKDHRPDLEQLVRTLAVASDGAVPIACRADDGNTSDDLTLALLQREVSGLPGTSPAAHAGD